MTEKQNLMRILQGESPAWVPITMYQKGVSSSRKESLRTCVPSAIDGLMTGNNGAKDVWGVEYVFNEAAGGSYIHKPGGHLLDLDDIERWPQYIQAPDLSDVNWEAVAGAQLAAIDRRETAVTLMLNCGYFITLVGILGFAETLIAFGAYEKEVREIVDYMSDFYAALIEKLLPIYRPDIISIGEDCVSADTPLISLEAFRRVLLPANKKQMRAARESGIPVIMHCCGRGELYIDDWVEAGIAMWECAFPKNDLLGIQKRYGNRLILNGGWEPSTNLSSLQAADDEIVRSVKDAIDRYAANGGFCFNGYFIGDRGDRETLRKNNLIVQTAEQYGRQIYGA